MDSAAPRVPPTSWHWAWSRSAGIAATVTAVVALTEPNDGTDPWHGFARAIAVAFLVVSLPILALVTAALVLSIRRKAPRTRVALAIAICLPITAYWYVSVTQEPGLAARLFVTGTWGSMTAVLLADPICVWRGHRRPVLSPGRWRPAPRR